MSTTALQHRAEDVVVIGAGVVGLTTALLLSKDSGRTVRVVASYMPGDYHVEYASPWAGANYDTYSPRGTYHNLLEKNTWPELSRLAESCPEAGVHFQDTKCILRSKDQNTERYRAMQNSSINHPWLEHWNEAGYQGVDQVVCFRSVCINTAVYLGWLFCQCLKAGIVFQRSTLRHIKEAVDPESHKTIIINCTGLGARSLGGVKDESVYPVRGQTVLVEQQLSAMYAVSSAEGSQVERIYTMTRPAGGGTILGGCYQPNDWDPETDKSLADRILDRCASLCRAQGEAALKGEDFRWNVVRHNVGLRPARDTGVRIEEEDIDGSTVIHCYGHGGAGYQQSYGSAHEVLRIVQQISGRRDSERTSWKHEMTMSH